MKHAAEEGYDCVLIDTAGRMQVFWFRRVFVLQNGLGCRSCTCASSFCAVVPSSFFAINARCTLSDGNHF